MLIPILGIEDLRIDMVVERRGFRGRWQNSSAAASAADLSADADDVSFADASNQWETVDAPDVSLLFGSASCL